ncbi:MAG: lysozyme inhibitor LprI family protein, partial [Pyrinomonadaceae bacterium]
MKRIFATTIIITSVLGVVVFAQKKKPAKDPCKDPLSQSEMNVCSRRDYEKADAEMNKVYKQLMLELAGYGSDPRPKFQEAQSLWIKYREANCDSDASLYEGGSIRPTIYYSCLASVTRERTKMLKAFLVEIRG